MSEPYRLLDLFSGLGAFSLGLERASNFKTVAFCEIEPFCRKVLAKHWPEIPCYDDIRTLNAERLRSDGISVDAICGGFPCQDISIAGLGKGLAGERSGLFYHVARLAGELRPRLIILENVSELLGRGMGDVLGTLASLGYDVKWRCIPASELGLPQKRDRIWIVAADPLQVGGSRFIESLDLGTNEQGRPCSEKDLREVFATPLQPGSRFPQPILRRSDNRPANWVDRVGACGNAVTPLIPELIGRAIAQAERAA